MKLRRFTDKPKNKNNVVNVTTNYPQHDLKLDIEEGTCVEKSNVPGLFKIGYDYLHETLNVFNQNGDFVGGYEVIA